MIHKIKRKHSGPVGIVVVLLLVCTLTVTAFAAADLSSTIGVTGLTANSSGQKDWTASAGGAVWEGSTSSDGGCSPTYTATNGTLKFTNNSGSTQVLSFSYTLSLQGGTFTINGESKTANSTFSTTLKNGEGVTLVANSSSSNATTTKVTLSNIKLEVQQVTVTFKTATNGSYTVDGTKITEDISKTAASTTVYKLVATPEDNYHFAGWYLGDNRVSETTTYNASFATAGNVTAKFTVDPLFNKTTTAEGSSKTKDQLVSINTWYSHDSTEKLVKDGSLPGSNSAYSKLAQSAIKDKVDIQYIPSRVWNDSMGISYSATAMGDYGTGGAQESYAYARVLSDVIRIYAKENCNVSFSYSGSMTTSGSTSVGKDTSANFYTYVTTASSATVAQVQGGTKYTGSGTTPAIALSKGQYLYILAEGYARNRYMAVFSASQFSMDFDYSASITGLTVEFNEKKDILTAGFRDNTGKVLTSGTINVNSVGQMIGSNGNMADMSFADLAFVSMSVGSVPANYVHIGWEITPKGGATTYQYTPTYSRTLTEDVTVNALFVPKTTITMGANGYTDATYKDFNGNALSGQYVARNANCTAYYTSLADAFGKSDTVVLLADTTIEGDWTIPAGKTFVIPYGINDKGSTTPEMGWGMGADYCLVNLNGNLTVEGTLIVNAQQNQSSGAPGGNPGHLAVASDKTITVSGSLYAYGPVTGTGKVETTSTAKIHETMEFSDNDVVIYIYNIYSEKSSKQVFPFNTMFINSIEIPVTYQQGATLTGHVAVKYDTVSIAAIPIIAPSGAMMNHTAGTITKYFDHRTGQFVFQYNEGSKVSTGAFSITLSVTVVGMTQDITMNSADFFIPLSAPFRYEIAGELTLNDKYKLLPGMAVDVKDTGKLIVAEGSEVVAYRRNDFDYRGKGSAITQTGYTRAAYPSNPQRFNGGSYPLSLNNSNMGSAKLNVDGKLIVNGGLYVTDELQEEGNGITLTENGYNILTGTGTIDMTNAETSLSSVNEVMRASGTNDLAWDTVAVVPIKGLKADATADDPAQYESLTGIMKGSINANGLNVWSTPKYVAEVNEKPYMSLREALEKAGEGGTVKLLDVPEDIAIGQNVIIQLNGIDYTIRCAEGWGAIDNEDGSFTIKQGIFKIYASNVKVGDCLDMYFYIKTEDLKEEGYYAQIVKTFADDRENTTELVPYEDWVGYQNNQYMRFSFSGIAAKEMTDEIYVTIYKVGQDGEIGTDDDEVASSKCTDSIENYAIRTLKNIPVEDNSEGKIALRGILIDLLNYGEACQKQFGYNPDDLATARLSDEQKAYATTSADWNEPFEDNSSSSEHFIGSSVDTVSRMTYRLYFTDINPTESTKAYITYTNFYGQKIANEPADIQLSEQYSTYYYVDVKGLAISDGRQLISCIIKDGTEEIAFVNDTVEGCARRYIAGNNDEISENAYTMLLNFIYSAENYFGLMK